MRRKKLDTYATPQQILCAKSKDWSRQYTALKVLAIGLTVIFVIAMFIK